MIVAPNEARRIAANVAKLPDLLSAEQRRDGNPLVQTPCIGKQGSVKEPVGRALVRCLGAAAFDFHGHSPSCCLLSRRGARRRKHNESAACRAKRCSSCDHAFCSKPMIGGGLIPSHASKI
jgi:hypothetical protein